MRVKRLATFLVLGIAIALAYGARRRRGAPARRAVPAGAGARGTAAELESRLWRGDQAGDLLDEEIAGWDAAPPMALDLEVTVVMANDEDLGADAGVWIGERAFDLAEDADPHAGQHEKATTDTPVADRGSGGPRGL